jgi:hypothetical protein
VKGWFGAEAKPRACYAGVSRARLYHEPDASSLVVGELRLYEGVLAYRDEDGFTGVRSEQSGRSGWVRSSQLTSDLPRARKPVAAPPSPPASAQAQPPPPATAEPEPADEPPPEPEPAPREPEPEKSVFDPY